ncbi:flagellar motor protein [Parvularcula bermudensis HTCC2503]|uniref:Flagellar motor switch protein FliG n=2 Tax=Parvularcula TaxID=208215 RepID=E0TGK6_PARBH|nr:flagellar motor protein [Parvularcula bermudensis HTCC2503]
MPAAISGQGTDQQVVPSPPNKPRLDRRPGEKAAAVLALLSETTLQSLHGKLSDARRDQLVESLSGLRAVSPSEQKLLVREFAQRLKEEKVSVRGGTSLASKLGTRLFVEDEPDFDPIEMEPEEEINPIGEGVWGEVSKLPIDVLADFLNSRPPAVVGIVLASLSADRSSELANALTIDLVKASLKHIGMTGKPSALAVEAVEALMQRDLLDTLGDTGEKDNKNAIRVADILNRVPSRYRDTILEAIRRDLDPEEVTPIASRVLNFTALEDRAPRQVVPLLFREIELPVLLTAMKYSESQSKPMTDYLLGNISQRLADQYREQLAKMPAPAEDQGEKAQSDVVCRVMEMVEDGRIELAPTDATEA